MASKVLQHIAASTGGNANQLTSPAASESNDLMAGGSSSGNAGNSHDGKTPNAGSQNVSSPSNTPKQAPSVRNLRPALRPEGTPPRLVGRVQWSPQLVEVCEYHARNEDSADETTPLITPPARPSESSSSPSKNSNKRQGFPHGSAAASGAVGPSSEYPKMSPRAQKHKSAKGRKAMEALETKNEKDMNEAGQNILNTSIANKHTTSHIPTATKTEKLTRSSSPSIFESFSHNLKMFMGKKPQPHAEDPASLTSGSDILDIEQRAVAGLLSCFRDMVMIQTEPISDRATIEHAAVNSLKMESKTQEMIKHAEDLLKLTRRIRELWIIGPLRPADGITGEPEMSDEDRKLMQDVEAYEKLTNNLAEQKYANLVSSLGGGSYQVVEKLDEVPGEASGSGDK
ncbi:hypothetical protein MKZ38_002764 [Zalerion maritima]|uniref:Uncharacterized protein n=1 Tax=Zalerion maritima TaxID=339359 RepID=A0AAD5RPP2_9PEZI|nr:hypothetical protein MKZ38_002764 [Zalerion maritima]